MYDTLNPEILNYIINKAPPGTAILDIGCGTGRLGRELKNKISCTIVGIENDSDAVRIAKETYDAVHAINLEKGLVIQNNAKFDYAVCGDILEHVANPENLLLAVRQVLKENGILIASIPNVANWMVRMKLLCGNFDYSGGILDKGHVKFYTYKTARQLLMQCGYKIHAVTNNNQTLIIRALGRLWKKLFAFQFVFICSMEKMPIDNS